MPRELKDFDSLNDEPLRFKVGGTEYEIPSDLPAIVGLDFMGKDLANMNETEAFTRIVKLTLGEEKYEEIARNAGINQFMELAKWLMTELLGVEFKEGEEAGEEGNVPSGEEKTNPSPSPSQESSNTGPSLKPITGGFGGLVPEITEEAAG